LKGMGPTLTGSLVTGSLVTESPVTESLVTGENWLSRVDRLVSGQALLVGLPQRRVLSGQGTRSHFTRL
jgi:hypothetical protein